MGLFDRRADDSEDYERARRSSKNTSTQTMTITSRLIAILSSIPRAVADVTEFAERFIAEVRGDHPEVAAKLRIEERQLEAGGLN